MRLTIQRFQLLIQPLKLLPEIEIVKSLLYYSHVATGIETPSLRFDLLQRSYFAESWHIGICPLGERLLYPGCTSLAGFYVFATIEAHDIGDKFYIFGQELTVRSVDLPVNVACIDKKHAILARRPSFPLVKEPERAGQRHRIKEIRTDRNDHIHALLLQQLAADLQLR